MRGFTVAAVVGWDMASKCVDVLAHDALDAEHMAGWAFGNCPVMVMDVHEHDARFDTHDAHVCAYWDAQDALAWDEFHAF